MQCAACLKLAESKQFDLDRFWAMDGSGLATRAGKDEILAITNSADAKKFKEAWTLLVNERAAMDAMYEAVTKEKIVSVTSESFKTTVGKHNDEEA